MIVLHGRSSWINLESECLNYVIELDSNLVYVRSSLHLRIKSRREGTVCRLENI